ncbi:MAG: LuxR C-terminal-related transcriptional regulator [Acidimicrobiia bacterium]
MQGDPRRLRRRPQSLLQMGRTDPSNTEIAEELYVSEATVTTHASHILTKLHLRDLV